MQIIIKTKNIELTDSLEKFIQTKIGKLNKFFHTEAEIFIEIERESLHHKKGEIFSAEAIVVLSGKKLVALAKNEDIGKAITEVKEEMEIELKKYKLKKIELPRRLARKSKEENF